MEHNLVNEELMNEQSHDENQQNTHHEESPKVEVVENTQNTEVVSAEVTTSETQTETAEPQAEIHSVTEPQAENEVVKEEASTESFTENAALAEVKKLLMSGNASEYIPKAESSELVLFMDQLGHNLNAENFSHFMELGRLIKDTFEARSKEGAVSQEQAQRFSAAYGSFSKRKTEYQRNIEEHNTTRKRDLIQRLKDLMESGSVNHNIVKEIQTEWKTLRFVTKEIKEEIDNTYRSLLDTYYKRKGQEMELMDYDRKRNLEIKTSIIEKIRALLPNEEESSNFDIWKERANILNELQKEWREAGHVPREDMEKLNLEYKDVVDNFYAQRREFVESQEQGMHENGEKKEAILVKMTPFIEFKSEKPRAWEDATKELIALQEEWKTVGKAPIEKNTELWKKFREVGNSFFNNKSSFFKNLETERNQNLELKTVIADKAESLKDSLEWDKAGKIFRELQEEWKKIGPVPDRFSNKIWNRFREASDFFYNRKREFFKDIKGEEDENLEKKRSLIDRVKEIVANIEDREASFQEVREIQAKWKEIGKVPIKVKDTIWDEFTRELDGFFEMLRGMKREGGNNNAGNGNNDRDKQKRNNTGNNNNRNFNKSNRNDNDRGGFEKNNEDDRIQRLRKKITKSNETINQYSTNILFITKGKSGDAFRKQIQDEIDKETALVADYTKQIKEIQAQNEKAKAVEAPEVVAENTEVVNTAETNEVVDSETTVNEVVETAEVTETPAEEPVAEIEEEKEA